jgi:predicted NAD/FAD-binding protein
MPSSDRLRVAVVGTGVSGLSAAWLLNPRHEVTVYEKAGRIGGHSNTVSVSLDGAEIPVDTGFIVFNSATYPNFVEMLRVLGAESRETNMSFSASLHGGALEYSGAGVAGLFSQRSNLVRPAHWRMVADLVRFYRRATKDAQGPLAEETTLGAYLAAGGFGAALRDHHIVPMASAIWSAPPAEILDYPAAAFLRFHLNHGLLRLTGRPVWRTVVGGAQAYVSRLIRPLGSRVRIGVGAVRIERIRGRVAVTDSQGGRDTFDRVVIATHADEALALLAAPDARERAILDAFRYSRNEAWLHLDETLMPRRRAAWSSWNFVSGAHAPERASVTYWMNALQRLPTRRNVFVTLNPERRPDSALRVEAYDHPIFDMAALKAQKALWSLQGAGGVWFCGAHFGAGFHEDGLQAGLAVAEQMGGVRRPWRVENESARIVVGAPPPSPPAQEKAA